MLERLKRWLLPANPAQPATAANDFELPPPPHPASTRSPVDMVIDVRSEREFHATAIEGAVNVPLPQLAHRISELVADTATPLVLYCASGVRSGSGCVLLKQMGYTNVTNAGGLYAAAERLQREVRR